MDHDAALPDVPPEGSLGLLAHGYRGVVAWRAARGTDWLEAERERVEARGRRPPARGGPALEALSVVVVTGLPRSGTSMLMQMLAAGGLEAFSDGARAPDANNPRGFLEHARVRALARDAEWLPEADGRAVKVVAPLLPHLPAGPAYRVVWLDRDLDEVLRSQRRMLARLGRPAAPDDTLRAAYARHLEAAAAWTETTPRVGVLRLDYARVTEAPTEAARTLAAFLDRGLDVEAIAAAVDPALYRERAST